MKTLGPGVAWIIFAALLVQTGNALQTDLLGVRAGLEGFSPATIGFVMAAYYVGFSAVTLPSHVIVGRFGAVRVILAATVLAAIAIVIAAWWITPLYWGLLRLLSGAAISILYISVESWINAAVENAQRGRVFSVYMTAQMIAMTLAQFLFAAGSPRTVQLFLLAGALFVSAAVPVLITRRAAPAHGAPPEPFGLARLFAASPLGAWLTFLAGASWSIVFAFGPVYARGAGFSVSDTGLFMACAMAAGAVLQYPFGYLSDHAGRRVTIIIMTALALLASLFGYWATGEGAAAKLLASALMGSTVFPLYAISVARTNDSIAPQNRVAAAGGLVLLFGLGSILGPALSGLAVTAAGPAGFFMLLAATMAACLAAASFAR